MNYTNSVDYKPFKENIDRNPIVVENNQKQNYIDNPDTIVYQYPIDTETPSIHTGTPSIHIGNPSIDTGNPSIDTGPPSIDNEEYTIDNEEQERINKLHRESISNHITNINHDLDFIYRFLDKPEKKNVEEANCCSKNCIIL